MTLSQQLPWRPTVWHCLPHRSCIARHTCFPIVGKSMYAPGPGIDRSLSTKEEYVPLVTSAPVRRAPPLPHNGDNAVSRGGCCDKMAIHCSDHLPHGTAELGSARHVGNSVRGRVGNPHGLSRQ